MQTQPKVVFEDAYAQLEASLYAMFCGLGLEAMSGMKLYQLVYEMCNAVPTPHCESLFTAIARFLELHIDALYQEVAKAPDILTAYASAWRRYSVAAKSTDHICGYLNRMLLERRLRDGRHLGEPLPKWTCVYHRQSIKSLTNTIWRKRMVLRLRREQEDRLIRQLLAALESDRDGTRTLSSSILQDIIQSLVSLGDGMKEPLGFYQRLLEAAWVYRTRSYYEREAKQAVSALSLSEFINKANKRLEEESERCCHYMDPSSHDKILHPMITEYVVRHTTLIYNDFQRMLLAEQRRDCSAAYTLLLRVKDGVVPLQLAFETYVKDGCRRSLGVLDWSSSKMVDEYMDQLVVLYQRYSAICESYFAADTGFVAAFDKAMHAILNNRQVSRQAELLARHCDILLRRKTRQPVDAVEARLRVVLKLFSYVDDKDVFQKFYTRFMARRLITDASASEELELLVISQLKNSCGVDFVAKWQRMLTDIELNRDLNNSWRNWQRAQHSVRQAKGNELGVLILTTKAWPIAPSNLSTLQISPALEQCLNQFGSFYQQQFNGRKLTWLWHISKADVRMRHGGRSYELSATLYQLAVLLCFNDRTRCTLQDLSRHTGLHEADLTRTIKSLVDSGLFVQAADATSTGSTWQQCLQLNPDFKSKRTRIKICTALQMESPQEHSVTGKLVEEDRRLFLQSALVRVMKARRELPHTDLVAEILQLARTHFVPDVGMIKRSIEQLIDRQYIERDAANRDMYRYLA